MFKERYFCPAQGLFAIIAGNDSQAICEAATRSDYRTERNSLYYREPV